MSKPGSDGDFTYDNDRSYGVETDRWEGPTSPEEWAAILDHPVMPTRDHAGSYAHLVQRNPLVELASDAAAELRARVTGRAA